MSARPARGGKAPAEPLPADTLAQLVELAARAPSLHNSQPWRFENRSGLIELSADRSRWPRWGDSTGRELVLSCGAALFTLQVAIRSLGLRPDVERLPDPDRPDLLARVGAGGPRPATLADAALLKAVLRRHTHRTGFSGEPVEPVLRTRLQRTAELHGVRLHLLELPQQRAITARLSAEGARLARSQPLRQAEQRRWASSGGERRDGVPVTARTGTRSTYGLAPRWGCPGSASPTNGHVLALLATGGDQPGDWLRAGEALQHVLLLAASEWVFADIDSQTVEAPALRRRLMRELHLTEWPQLLLALGRAGAAPLTPRRPVQDVLADAGA